MYYLYYPIWADWDCCASGSLAWHQFFVSQLTIRDAPPWGTWFRTLHWWRKVEKDRRRKKALHLAGLKCTTSWLWGMCSTTVPQRLLMMAVQNPNLTFVITQQLWVWILVTPKYIIWLFLCRFPGLTDLVNGIEAMTKEELEVRVRALKRHVSDLTVVIHQAADYLKDVSVFWNQQD